MSYLALLGDGILANRAHTGREPDSATLLGELLPGWTVSLLAAEGVTMDAVATQVQRLRTDVDLAVLSVGGNDAMEHVDILEQPTQSSAHTLDALTNIVDDFGFKYDQAAKAACGRTTRLVVCTIYEPPLVGTNTASRARVLLTLLNDRILRVACQWGLDVLDLRAICTSRGDFTVQIQPSAAGAAKIARAIAGVAAGTGGRRVTVIAG
ncbi:MAG: hypothetical protein DMD62_02765 [Gemmatimonadetes bacterium]|nr:MAG: hypothetical protein DMD62_02765 [Gemmatimonadota bacterium]